ncbi:hypothetical protein [Aeromicrobium sp.]|uniref:hypothetical protein n=1 Tax=Aeromicrobium sp. TaxID=1871063 RepID=UPI00199FCCBE|nr:hypothetical protein [Aeromicrobium sp.]MBC7630362.1 hypothetical protein [Aeromicrobium sp.]
MSLSAGIQVAIEAIEEIKNRGLTDAENLATSATSEFRHNRTPLHAFSSFPMAAEVAQQQDAAYQVYVSTIDGVLADLRTFQANLGGNVNSWKTVDEDTQARLIKFASNFGDTSLQSVTANEQARETYAEKLGVPADQGTSTVDSGSTAEPGAEVPPSANGSSDLSFG